VWNFGVTLTVMNLPSSGFLTTLDIYFSGDLRAV
jgi:hypothetical protein